MIRQNLDCRDLVDEAKKYHLRPECRQAMQNNRTKSRIGLSEVMYVLGGFGNLQSPVDVVEKYDPAACAVLPALIAMAEINLQLPHDILPSVTVQVASMC